jgi:4-alpha-glucanotransferase
MAERDLHAYRVFLLERDGTGFHDPAHWPSGALACVSTHDLPTIAGWATGVDIELRQRLGWIDATACEAEQLARRGVVEELKAQFGADTGKLALKLHSHIANSRCRLAALQIEDMLGVAEQVNVPGTIHQYPNWRRRLPVGVEALADDSGFSAHAAAMRAMRPKTAS